MTRNEFNTTFNTSYKSALIAIHGDTTFILELARKGCTKINSSSMPTFERGGDTLIPLNKVPLHIRRAARLHLGVAA